MKTKDFGRVGHSDDDEFNLFVCFVTEKMRSVSKHEWGEVFSLLVNGRRDLYKVRKEVWKKLRS